TYSSYSGSLGMWTYFPIGTGVDLQQMGLMNGIFQYIGMPAGIDPVVLYGGAPLKNTGSVTPVKTASGTHGTSHTIAFGEHAHWLFSQTPTTNPNGLVINDFYGWNWWTSGNYGDTLFTTFYPMNPQRKIGVGYYNNPGVTDNQGDAMVLAASS